MYKKFEIKQDLKILVDFIASKYKPEKVILFGSYGTKKKTESSDIDLLIIKQTDKRFVDRIVDLTHLIRDKFGFEYPVESLIYTPKEWKSAKQINSTFTRAILSKGVILYEKK